MRYICSKDGNIKTGNIQKIFIKQVYTCIFNQTELTTAETTAYSTQNTSIFSVIFLAFPY